MTIKSFRGKLGDAEQDTITLHTNDGSTGYRIVKFQVMSVDGNTAHEGTVQIFKIQQTTIPTEIDFQDNTLLGAAIILQTVNNQDSSPATVIFDNEIFNQDIYVTYKESGGGASGETFNYYIELEMMKLDLTENTVATLKDIRNIKSR